MPLQVIGVGLGRTGTMSLKLALEQIGLGPCYHMAEVFLNPERVPLWIAAADGQPNWEAVFQGYASTMDYPACIYWRELTSAYPGAKVILSLRSADKWFESTQATIFSDAMDKRIRSSPLVPFFEKTVWRDFGERIHDRDFMMAYFDRHTAAVKAAIPKQRLLVYEVSQGWEPLCEFLGVDAPATPFPRVNSREEMQQRMATPTNDQEMRKAARDYLKRMQDKT
jgi:sulfotransferase family protein